MINDPRRLVQTDNLRVLQQVGLERYEIRQRTQYSSEWPEVVAFATAILAANEAWLDSQTPTLEELRERYPDEHLGIVEQPSGVMYAYCGPARMRHFEYTKTRNQGIRWLAAELAKRGKE